MPNQNFRGRWAIVCGLLLCFVSIWLFEHPYQGMYQDTNLYAFLALNHLEPQAYQNDLFLRYGSQARYSLFDLPYSLVIRWLGLPAATLLLTVLGQILWFGGLLTLVRCLLPRLWLIGIAAVVLVNPYYDPFLGFLYGEAHLSPRIFAEAACMLAMAALWRSHFVRAAALVALGGLFHPLMASLPCLVCLLTLLSNPGYSLRRRCGIGVAVVAGGVALVWGVVGLDVLAASIDTSWFTILPRYLFPEFWTRGGFFKALFFCLVFGLAWYYRCVAQRRILLVLVLALVIAGSTWIIGSGVYRNVFVTQLQLWRGLWLIQLCGILMVVALLGRLARGGGAEAWLAAFLALAACSLGLFGEEPSGEVALITAIAGGMAGLIVKLVPGSMRERPILSRLPFVILTPVWLEYCISHVEVHLVAVALCLFFGMVGKGSRSVVASVCALLVLGLAPMLAEEWHASVAMAGYLMWMLAAEHDHPGLLRWWVRCLLVVLAGLLVVRADVFVPALRMEYLAGIAPLAGSALWRWAGVALVSCACVAGWRVRRDEQAIRFVWLSVVPGVSMLIVALYCWLPAAVSLVDMTRLAWVQQLREQIPRQAVVMSDRGVGWSWFVLHRSFYASHVQIFGTVFSRGNALEGARRRQFLCGIQPRFCENPTSELDSASSTSPLSDKDVRRLCQDYALDYLILRGVFSEADRIIVDDQGGRNSLLVCARLRIQV